MTNPQPTKQTPEEIIDDISIRFNFSTWGFAAKLDFRKCLIEAIRSERQALEAAKKEIERLKSKLHYPDALSKSEYERLVEWMNNPNRKPANTAFTASACRDAARAFEESERAAQKEIELLKEQLDVANEIQLGDRNHLKASHEQLLTLTAENAKMREALETERTMHNAWRKRAEEAEAENLKFIENNVGIIGEWGVMERALKEILPSLHGQLRRVADHALSAKTPNVLKELQAAQKEIESLRSGIDAIETQLRAQLLSLTAENARLRAYLKKIATLTFSENMKESAKDALSTPPSEALSVAMEVVKALKFYAERKHFSAKAYIDQETGEDVRGECETDKGEYAKKALAHFEAVFGRVDK